MRNNFLKIISLSFLFLGFLLPAQAQVEKDNHVEFEYSHAFLNSGFNDWNDVNILNYLGWKGERFVIETDYKNRFGAGAGVLGATWTHVWDNLWYQDFSTSFSTNDSILPGFVVFTEIHRKLLADQSLVLGLGVGHNSNEAPYSDTYGLFEGTYYLGGPISLQAGVRLNNSSPGDVFTERGFGNVNFAYDRFDGYVRYEAGKEGYTVIAQNTFRNEFSSRDESAVLHYWYNGTKGVGLRLDFYQSDFYNRSEIAVEWLMKY